MEEKSPIHFPLHNTGTLAVFAAIVILLPLPVAYITGQSLMVTLALMASTFIIEYGAAPVGIFGGLDRIVVLFVLSCIALGVTLLLFYLCGTLEEHWPRLARILDKTRSRAKSSLFLTKYGIFGLVPLVIVLGFYVCAPAACNLGWRRDHATILIMAGYMIACIVTILLTHGATMVFVPVAGCICRMTPVQEKLQSPSSLPLPGPLRHSGPRSLPGRMPST